MENDCSQKNDTDESAPAFHGVHQTEESSLSCDDNLCSSAQRVDKRTKKPKHQARMAEAAVQTDHSARGSVAHPSNFGQVRRSQESDEHLAVVPAKLERLEDILLKECENLLTDLDNSSGDSAYLKTQCTKQPTDGNYSTACGDEIRYPLPDLTFQKGVFTLSFVSGLDENVQAAFLFLTYSPYAMAAISTYDTRLSHVFAHQSALKSKGRFLNKACKSLYGAESVLRFLVAQLEIDYFKPNRVVPGADSLERFMADERTRYNAFLSQVMRTIERVEKTCKCGIQATYLSLESLDVVFTARAATIRLADQLAHLTQHAAICDVCLDVARIRTRVLNPARQLFIFTSFANHFTRSPITVDLRLEKRACGALFAECPVNFEYRLNAVMRKAHGGYVTFHVSDGVEEYQTVDGKLMQRKFRPTDPWIVALSYERVDL